jgi:hypothetical protein
MVSQAGESTYEELALSHLGFFRSPCLDASPPKQAMLHQKTHIQNLSVHVGLISTERSKKENNSLFI